MQVLNGGVVGVLVRHEEGSTNLAAIGVLTLTIEDVLVQVNIVDVNGSIECDGDHLGHLRWFNVAGNASSVSGTEAIGQDTLGCVAVGRTVWI
jgi:hypothetical protein